MLACTYTYVSLTSVLFKEYLDRLCARHDPFQHAVSHTKAQGRYSHLHGGLAYFKLKMGKFLVMDDHRFFKIFLQSVIAEESLHSVCARTLAIQQGVRVKLAGEVIKGLKV